MSLNSQENLDKYIFDRREEEYKKNRMNTFISQFSKHYEKKCHCAKKGKRCIASGTIDLNKFSNMEYLITLYENGTLDTLYNMCQSTTQSLRSTTGSCFENIIEEILVKNNIKYQSQVQVDDKHIVDFIVKTPNSDNDIILSCKSSLRERYLQTEYLKDKYEIFTITMDKTLRKNCITVDSGKKTFTKWFKQKFCSDKMKVLDLFCGAGGFSQGFKKAGFDIVVGIDKWDKAIETYKKNHDHIALCKDLTTYTPSKLVKEYKIKDIDVIIGGPPCQGFSSAGKRDVNDPRNSLFMEFKKYLDYFVPKMFIMENVMGILSMKNEKGEKYIDIITNLLKENYEIITCKLYTSDFGVPQNRRRVLIFGIRKDLGIIPYEPVALFKKDERLPVSSVLENKKDIEQSYYLSKRALEGIKRKEERMKKEGKGFGAQFLNFDKPSYTIPARYWKDGYDALVKYSDDDIRRLTILELARIQTFPDSYKFVGSKKEIIMQIGNAVACRFAYHMAKHLKTMLENKDAVKDEVNDLNNLTVKELKEMCKKRKIKRYSKLRKAELIELLSK